MEEKKEKKTIKCSYAVLVIILFAALAFVTDYAYIERKTRKCDCPKCEATKNKVISDNTDNTQVIESDENSNGGIVSWGKDIYCKEYSENYCLISNTNNKIELFMNNGLINQINVNGKQFKLKDNEGIYNVNETLDGNILVSYGFQSTSNFVLLDSNLNIITDFKDYFDDRGTSAVKYENGKYVINTYMWYSSPSSACGSFDDDSFFKNSKELKYLDDGQFEVISNIDYSFKEVIQLETKYSSCEEILSRNSN